MWGLLLPQAPVPGCARDGSQGTRVGMLGVQVGTSSPCHFLLVPLLRENWGENFN